MAHQQHGCRLNADDRGQTDCLTDFCAVCKSQLNAVLCARLTRAGLVVRKIKGARGVLLGADGEGTVLPVCDTDTLAGRQIAVARGSGGELLSNKRKLVEAAEKRVAGPLQAARAFDAAAGAGTPLTPTKPTCSAHSWLPDSAGQSARLQGSIGA